MRNSLCPGAFRIPDRPNKNEERKGKKGRTCLSGMCCTAGERVQKESSVFPRLNLTYLTYQGRLCHTLVRGNKTKRIIRAGWLLSLAGTTTRLCKPQLSNMTVFQAKMPQVCQSRFNGCFFSLNSAEKY